MSEKSSTKGSGPSSSDTSKVTFFGQPAWVVISGLAVAAILLVLIINFSSRGVPSDAVATVDGESIPVADFNRALKQSAQQGGAVLDPPNFTKCIAAKKEETPKLSQSSLKKACEKEWNTTKDGIMTGLVQQKWFELEAQDRGIEITDADVKTQIDTLKKQRWPKDTDAEFNKFLKENDVTEEVVTRQVRVQMLQEKVQQDVNSIPTPSTGAVEAEYNENKDDYATPATRDLNLVFNSSKAKVESAKSDLDSGDSWSSVAKEYSQDSASKQNGGKFPGVTKGQFPEELDKAVFAAKKGEIIGPIKTQYGYYVFEVTKVTPGKQQSIKQATEQIRSTLLQEAQQKAQETFQKEFTDQWRKKTRCAKDFKVVEVCGNTPKPKESSTEETGQ